jgi:hypothetical protein
VWQQLNITIKGNTIMRTRTRDDNLGPIKDGDVVRTRMMAMDHKTVDSVDAMLNREL